MSGPRRVIVGASGSPGNLCALRYAEHLARAAGATLIPVHAWIPPGGDVADRRCPSFYLRRVWTEDARQRLREALDVAWGQPPADLTIEPVVERGEPGAVLTSIANQEGDVLVIGAGRRGTLTHLFSGRVSRYCLAHAYVPVVAIPPPALAAQLHSPPGTLMAFTIDRYRMRARGSAGVIRTSWLRLRPRMDPVRLLVIICPEGFGEHRSIETGTAVLRCSGGPGLPWPRSAGLFWVSCGIACLPGGGR